MPYDNLCKALVELNPLPFVHWLVGQTPEPVQILKTELSVEFVTDTTLHHYRVVRIWEEPAKALLRDPSLWPLAILAGAEQLEELLRQVVT
ncbi:MAG: hypothetical protein SNJ68_09885 [Cyanobacteriota bacterium]